LFLHSRDAHPRFAEIIKHHGVTKAVAHCFTGEKDELHAYVDLGLYIGITGWICDERRGTHLLKLVQEIPRERLLIETDSPYLVPRDMKPQPKARRNEPEEEIAAETTRNARRFFDLDEPRSSAAAQRPLAA
jgi:TatD DNase family protein